MKFILKKQYHVGKTTLTLIGFTVFLIILALGSCAEEITAPPGGGSTTFQQDIENATTVPNLATANALTREVLSPLGSIRGGATLEKRYVTQNGGATTRDGTSWGNAWAAANLRSSIDAISDATANKVYLIMVAGGTYKPNYSTTVGTTERAISFKMTNHVAIMGGFDPAGGWERTGTTIFSGDIGTVGSTNDNSYNVFFHNSLTLNNAHLYGVTITGGNANGVNPQNLGGGMYNSGSSPVLTRVVFSGNSALSGGGMYNSGSSPVLTSVVFSGNTTTFGGGMVNFNSSPVLTSVVFSGNTATAYGGGMHNASSSPVLTSVVFSGNTAFGSLGGGGMYNWVSSPVLIGAVFTNNRAANGGAMYNDNGTGIAGPLIVNTIFSGNTLSGAGRGPNIAVNVNSSGASSGAENIRIAGSVLGMGLAQPTNHIVGIGGSAPLNITYRSLTNGAVNFGADATLTINGMNFPYPTITASSSAINRGLFVRRSGTTYYFSEDESIWYTGFSATGGLVTVDTPPANATDLTATDIAGNPRVGRPDAGVYEVQ